jgi:phosphoenolpyruvate synthase/pyruvate phosphate dikinase
VESEKFLLKIKLEKDVDLREKLIEEYKKEFYYIKSNYLNSPILTSKLIVEMASTAHEQKKHSTKRISFKFTPQESTMIALLKDAEELRDGRKAINLMGSFVLARFLDEAVRRKGLDTNIINRAFWNEFPKLLFESSQFERILKDRQHASILFKDGKVNYLSHVALKEKETNLVGIKDVKGTPASTGEVIAKARVVFGSKQFSEFLDGEVLITEMTRPEFLPLMKKASAIVTDEGGLTSHAAIIARELKKPCIIGTKIATKIFKTGDVVKVDANKGIVEKL